MTGTEHRNDQPATNDATGASPAGAPAHRQRTLFLAALAVLTALSLWPIWSTAFLPMQDYPQHLFMAHLTATWHDPAFNWKEFYTLDLGPRPYMLWYLAMAALTAVLAVEAAGRILLSIYLLLIAALVWQSKRLAQRGHLPWGALLLFPFAFNQMYFLGFPNFLLSLPLVFLAVLDLDRMDLPTPKAHVRHAIYCLLLFLNHPYGVLVYICLAAASTVASREDLRQWAPRLAPSALLSVALGVWYLAAHRASSAPTSSPWEVTWWPLGESFAYYVLQFTGMRLIGGVDWGTVGGWVLVGMVMTLSWQPEMLSERYGRRLAVLYLSTIAGFLVLPFWMGYYSYFNLRLAPFSYFALALMFARFPVRGRKAAGLCAAIVLIIAGSLKTQQAVAREAESIRPVIAAMKKNALVLPLIADGRSEFLDPHFFYQIHQHETDYYHLRIGGGASPALFPNAMMPVQFRPGLRLPCPQTVTSFTWRDHGIRYDYVLTRKAPRGLHEELAKGSVLVARSGPWELYENKRCRGL